MVAELARARVSTLLRRVGQPRATPQSGLAQALTEYALRRTGVSRVVGVGGRRDVPPPNAGTPPPTGGAFSLGPIVVRDAAHGELASPLARILTRRPLRELHRDTALPERVADLHGWSFVREIDFATDVAAQHREADFMRRLLGESVPMATEEPSEDVAGRVESFASSFTFRVSVPGQHYSGLPNEELLDILAAHGRDFLQDTAELRAHVQQEVVAALGDAWNERDARAIAADAVREWIVRRFENGGGDITLAALDPMYRAWKARSGYSSAIGVKTGALLGAVKRAEVRVT